MPVKIPDSLPAKAVLEKENIFVMTENRARHQDIRPLKIAILNLMPQKMITETNLLRCLSNTPLQIEVDFLQTETYAPKNTPKDYLEAFYKKFSQIKNDKYDGLIITGAPVENIDFEDVKYWTELCRIMDWAKENVFSTLYICWGAQAGLYYNYGINKRPLPEKKFGVFKHRALVSGVPIFRGFDDVFKAPHSRHTEVSREDIEKEPRLQLLAISDEAGVYAAMSDDGRQIFILGHPEYEAGTLASEYFRDRDKGLPISLPAHYFPNDDDEQQPLVLWRSHAQLLYTNWLNYYVYQATPYDRDEIK